jgi:hypothetical protein
MTQILAVEVATGLSMFAVIGMELAIGHKFSAALMTLALSIYIVAGVNGF